ncbi:MAG: cytochrome P450, partial [archaeon]|nr:cytochrome P450 [archaeon]
MDKLPGPRRRMWPFGNADMIPKNGVEFLELMVDLSKTYGEVSTFWLGPRPLVFVTSPTITKELISKDPDSFEKGDAYNNLKPWLGSSILLSEGEHWRHKRTALGRAFRLAHLKAFAPIFSYSTARLVALLDGRLDGAAAAAGSGRSGLEVDPLDLMTRVTQDIIGLSAFGFDFHAVPSWPLRDPRCNHYHTLTQLMDSRDRSMLLNLMPNALYLLTPPGRVFKQSVEGLALEARQIIERRLSGEQPERPDLLSFMIEPDPDTEQQVMLSAQELVEEVNLFIFAGHETTSSTLTWALYFLAQHPDIMRRVRDEIDAIGGVEALSDYDSSSKLKTLTNVVKETPRLATPTIAFVRQPTVELEAQGYRFPAGVPIVFASHSCH